MLNALALFILVVIVVVGVVIAAMLGALPGKIARKREHPQADAINVCGWLGLLALGLAWPLALIWSYTRPADVAVESGSRDTSTGKGNEADQIKKEIGLRSSASFEEWSFACMRG
jgi:hypothetical protein